MSDIERELRRVLARTEPPAGFAERVAARVPKRVARRKPPAWLAAAAAFLVGVVGVGAFQYQQRMEAERAKSELMQALELTSSTLQQTKARILKGTGGEL